MAKKLLGTKRSIDQFQNISELLAAIKGVKKLP